MSQRKRESKRHQIICTCIVLIIRLKTGHLTIALENGHSAFCDSLNHMTNSTLVPGLYKQSTCRDGSGLTILYKSYIPAVYTLCCILSYSL